MVMDSQKPLSPADMSVEQVLSEKEKREHRTAQARRFLTDKKFQEEHLKRLRERNLSEFLSSRQDRQGKGNGQSPRTTEGVDRAIDAILEEREAHRRLEQAQLRAQQGTDRRAQQAVERQSVRMTDAAVGGLAGTIRLHRTGRLPGLPDDELQREVEREEIAYRESREKTKTGILDAVKAARDARILTFTDRNEKGSNGSGQ